MRIVSTLAAALICVALLESPLLDWTSAQAQTHAAAKKKGERKAATPKAGAQQQEERAAFTAQDQDAAVIPGIPDARVWGDSDSAFARLLPQASGPWLAISGGGSDGAYGAGVLTGWSEAGTRPEFATQAVHTRFVEAHLADLLASAAHLDDLCAWIDRTSQFLAWRR